MGQIRLTETSIGKPTHERPCFLPDEGCQVCDRTRARNSAPCCCFKVSGAPSAPSERRPYQFLAESVRMADVAFGATDVPAVWSVLDIIASIARSSETKLQTIKARTAPVATIRSVSMVCESLPCPLDWPSCSRPSSSRRQSESLAFPWFGDAHVSSRGKHHHVWSH